MRYIFTALTNIKRKTNAMLEMYPQAEDLK